MNSLMSSVKIKFFCLIVTVLPIFSLFGIADLKSMFIVVVNAYFSIVILSRISDNSKISVFIKKISFYIVILSLLVLIADSYFLVASTLHLFVTRFIAVICLLIACSSMSILHTCKTDQ